MRKKALIWLSVMALAWGAMIAPAAGGRYFVNDCGSTQQGGTCPPA